MPPEALRRVPRRPPGTRRHPGGGGARPGGYAGLVNARNAGFHK
ncbi:hypothetical protein STXM2123_1197 [Streptomyces sp. F-3]|nr:hypothetical protein STXM2123_1197 [Streptomyces sp. F-3]